MKKYLLVLMIATTTFYSFNIFAKNVELEWNAANCKKIDGYVDKDLMTLATKYEVPYSSVKFLGTKWSTACFMIFDTAKGPKKCLVNEYLSDDGGKTAFGRIDKMGIGAIVCD